MLLRAPNEEGPRGPVSLERDWAHRRADEDCLDVVLRILGLTANIEMDDLPVCSWKVVIFRVPPGNVGDVRRRATIRAAPSFRTTRGPCWPASVPCALRPTPRRPCAGH